MMNYENKVSVMKMAIVMIVILFVTKGYTQGKKYLTKEEVLNYWKLPSSESRWDSIVLSFSSKFNLPVIKFIDSIQVNNIDSVIIFSVSYPGYISASKCDTGMYPITTFVIWNKSGKSFVKKFDGVCSFDLGMGTSLDFFGFYGNNQARLKSEFFMPVIFNACLNDDMTFSYMTSVVSHEPDYFFVYKIGNECRSYEFSESFLANRESMFYDYNLELNAFAWWKEIKNMLDQLENSTRR